MNSSPFTLLAVAAGLAVAGAGAVALILTASGYLYRSLALWPHGRELSEPGKGGFAWPAVFAVLLGSALAHFATVQTPSAGVTQEAPLIAANIVTHWPKSTPVDHPGSVVLEPSSHFDDAQSCDVREPAREPRFEQDLLRYQQSIDDLSRRSPSVLVVLVGSYDYRALSAAAAAIHGSNPNLARERAHCFAQWLSGQISKESRRRVTFIETERAGLADSARSEAELAADRTVAMMAFPFGGDNE